jgi:hypothetical protein
MKVGQKAIVRWIAKRVSKRTQTPTEQVSHRVLSGEEVRQVAGGSGGSQLPKHTW